MPSRTAAKRAPTVASSPAAKNQERTSRAPQPGVKRDAASMATAGPKAVEDENADPVGPIGGRQAPGRGAQTASKRAARGAQ